ncbi:MAG: DUF4350 domain-containing protein [Planctomycetaceae bacterium]|nr:DUF4350 domain-containing protein [Planctomycetaceae bacterium]
MLTPRNAIVLASLLFAGFVLSSIYSALEPPGANGTGADSYGVGRPGGKALVELLHGLEIPVRRTIDPFDSNTSTDATLLLIAPDLMLVRTEPEPLRRIAAWVQRGGRLLVAPGLAGGTTESRLESLAEELEHYDAEVLETLGLSDVRVELMLSGDVPEDSPEDDGELVISSVSNSSTGPVADQVSELVTLGEALPEVLWGDERTPLWETRILDADGDERVLAASFAVESGEVVVLSDETLVSNVALSRGQNAVWLVHNILSGGRTRVVVDEFYHGLSVRGNAWWLLTKTHYACLAICGLLLLGVWTWRQGVLLGPPLAERSPSRRDIGEYIDAMGRFFLRSRESHRFLLTEIQNGVWRRLSHEVGLAPGQTDVNRLVAAIERRDAERGLRVREAILHSNELQIRSRAPSSEVFEAMRDLTATLQRGHSTNSTTELRTHGDAAAAVGG